jgi:hypothetical protein
LRRIRARRRSSSNAPLLIAGALVNLLLLILVLTFSYLREEPLFWMNEGGWSVEWRDLVRSGYYPLLALQLLLLIAFTGMSTYLLSSRRSSASLAVVLLPLLWGLYFLAIVNSVANNVDNLLNGRPLHWHPEATWSQF